MIGWSGFRAIAIVGLSAGLAMGFAGCAGGGGTTAEEEPTIDLAAEEAAIREINPAWLEAYRAKDAEGIADLFIAEGWQLGSDGLTEGREAIVAKNLAEFEETPEAMVDWGTKQVWVSKSGDLALERGWWSFDPDGPGEAAMDEGEYITVFTKVDGEWKVVVDAAASITPAGEM
jgi:uncharacterized protein (TIGR02246 family)